MGLLGLAVALAMRKSDGFEYHMVHTSDLSDNDL